jgi:hypothetical protein
MQMLTKHFRLELFDDSVAISRYNLLSIQDLTLETTKICLISRNVKCVIFFFFQMCNLDQKKNNRKICNKELLDYQVMHLH